MNTTRGHIAAFAIATIVLLGGCAMARTQAGAPGAPTTAPAPSEEPTFVGNWIASGVITIVGPAKEDCPIPWTEPATEGQTLTVSAYPGGGVGCAGEGETFVYTLGAPSSVDPAKPVTVILTPGSDIRTEVTIPPAPQDRELPDALGMSSAIPDAAVSWVSATQLVVMAYPPLASCIPVAGEIEITDAQTAAITLIADEAMLKADLVCTMEFSPHLSLVEVAAGVLDTDAKITITGAGEASIAPVTVTAIPKP